MKNQKGITLISLIITIIVMLILAGIALAFSVGENGVITKAEETKTVQSKAEELEIVSLAIANAKTSSLSSLNGEPEFDEVLIKQAIEKEFGTGSCDVEKVADYFVVTIKDTNNKYKVTVNGKVEKMNENGNQEPSVGDDNEEIDALEEYYLRLINVAYQLVEASKDEIDKAQNEMWDLMDSGREFELFNETEMCFIIDDYYYYASIDNFELKSLDKNSAEFKKYNEIFNELKDVEKKLNKLLSGYTYTKDTFSREEFKNYIENNIGKTVVDIHDKDFEVDNIDISSSIDEAVVFFYFTELSKQESIYKIESVRNGNQGGF